ncbi:MAG: YbaK/EbsC family protein [Spirochaetes bacterium]|nr:YbaK/EbsC family protein [Spirochaetota bacterium]
MSTEDVRAYLNNWNRGPDVVELDASTATVELAANALGVIPARIAKSIALKIAGKGIAVIVVAGDVKLDNKKFRGVFSTKPRMLSSEEALEFTGHAVGGVCPFALPPEVEVYLDKSLERFQTIFPACGSSNSMIELTPPELEEYSKSKGWVDVCAEAKIKNGTD